MPAQEPAKSHSKAPAKASKLPDNKDVPLVEKQTVVEKSNPASVEKEDQAIEVANVVDSAPKDKGNKGKNSKKSTLHYPKEELTLGDKKWAEVCLSQIRAHPRLTFSCSPFQKRFRNITI